MLHLSLLGTQFVLLLDLGERLFDLALFAYLGFRVIKKKW